MNTLRLKASLSLEFEPNSDYGGQTVRNLRLMRPLDHIVLQLLLVVCFQHFMISLTLEMKFNPSIVLKQFTFI